MSQTHKFDIISSINSLKVRPIKTGDQIPWHLLLMADPSKKLVKEYIRKDNIYLAFLNDKLVGEYVLVNLHAKIELKNIAVDKNYQGMGIGKKLVLDSIKRAREKKVKAIEVGTGNSSFSQLALYQKCGFRIKDILKNFFIENYHEKIIENGIPCIDMIRLEIAFN